MIEEFPDNAQKRPADSLAPDAANLVELFENSPFKGLDITFERDQDYGREVDL